jgi:uncharacterized membrane protein
MSAIAGWVEFAAAFAAFFASHAIPARPKVRAWLVAALGEGGYLALYVAMSIAVLGWLIAAAGRAPFVELWPYEPWQAWVPNFVMPIVCALIAFSIGAANPLSFGGSANAAFDPERPGVVGVARHPLLWALALWAFAHAVPNGDLAHVALFGLFGLFAILGMKAIDARKRRQMGAAAWDRLAARTSAWPLAALIDRRWRPVTSPDPRRLIAAAAVWTSLVALHPGVVGVSPWPP